MKKKLGILWLVAIILLSFNACDNGSTSGGGNDGKTDEITTGPDGSGGQDGSSNALENDKPTPNCQGLLDKAVEYFADLKLDEGIAKIREAYNQEYNDTTRMYYALAKLALVSTDTNTVNFMQKTCGFENYPKKLNALIDGDWWEACLEDGFVEKVAKANSKGLNNALDELVGILTATYDEVVEISKDMKQSSVTLPAELIDALELDEIFGSDGDILAGKAELDVVIAAMGLVKGGLEYVSAFDWLFDTSSIKTDMNVDDFITAIQSGTKLLTTTNKTMLDASKKSFIDAVNLAISSYDYITGNDNKVYPTEVKNTLKEYNVFYKAAKAFKDALENGGDFYVPDADMFDLKEWPTSESSDWLLKIDCGKMFSDGVLDNAVAKDKSGKVQFYTSYWWKYVDGNSYFSDDNNEKLLEGSFYSVHNGNVDKVESEVENINKDTTWYEWKCETSLSIKVKIPDCITIKDWDESDVFLPICSESYEDYWYSNYN